jgi:hypothetical protein
MNAGVDMWKRIVQFFQELRRHVWRPDSSPSNGEAAPAVPQAGSPVGRSALSTLEASCHPIASARDDPWPAQVRDLSTGNIGLLIKRRFEPGTLLAVELQSVTQDYSRTLVARVIQAKSQGGGDWMIGCILASRLDDDELEALRV